MGAQGTQEPFQKKPPEFEEIFKLAAIHTTAPPQCG
jgi:hypothetical protein